MIPLFRALVWLYPPSFRRRFGDDMIAVAADRLRGVAGRARALRSLRIVSDMLRHALAAWIDVRQDASPAALKERLPLMRHTGQDLKLAVRVHLSQPGITIVALMTLAVGIGATTAMFSMVEATLLRPLPYPSPSRLVVLNDSTDGGRSSVAYPNLMDWRRQSQTLEAAAGFARGDVNFSDGRDADRVAGIVATPELFDLTGTRAVLGRTFTSDEQKPERPRVVLLDEALWKQRFGGDPGVLGRTVSIDGTPETVIGVIPAVPGFGRVEVWRPLREGPLLSRRNHFLRAIARLKPGVLIETTRAELLGIAAGLERAYPETNAGWTVAVTPMKVDATEDLSALVLAGLGAMAAVLLIGCANIANLLLARAVMRRREFAVRAALGAGARRLVAQLLTESLVLSAAGGIAGVVLAIWATGLTRHAVEDQLRLWNPIVVNRAVLAWAAAVTTLVGILFGLAPALEARRRGASEALRGFQATPGSRRLTLALTAGQFALSVVLLTAAGLFAASLARLARVDPGFDPSGVVTFRISPPASRYGSAAAVTAFYDSLVTSLERIPGVERVAATSGLAVAGSSVQRGYIRDGDPVPTARRDVRLALYHLVTPDYFTALRIPVREGRTFTAADGAGAEPVAIVNETMARRLWGREPAAGRRIRIHTDETFARTVIAVVGDVRHGGLDDPVMPEYYVPFAQAPRPALSLVVRTAGSGDRIVPAVRRTLAAIDPDLPVYDVMTYDEILSDWFAPRELITGLLVAFGAITLTLAAIGVYGVTAASVNRRTREMGVRIAVGASQAAVMRTVVGGSMRHMLVGLAIGVPAAAGVGRALSAVLFDASPVDYTACGAAAALLALVAALAAYLPARRAAHVDPVVTLRQE